jgi:hypothetical protein
MRVPKSRSRIYLWISAGVVAVLLIVAVIVLLPDGDNDGGTQVEEAGEEEYIPWAWVRGTARVYVLAEMFEVDEESVLILGEQGNSFRSHGGQRWETNIDYFLDSGLLKEVDGELAVDTTVSVADAGNALPGGGHDQMASALGDTLEASQVTWCGEDVKGSVFAEDYVDAHYGEFDSRQEYVESIEEYVACSTG